MTDYRPQQWDDEKAGGNGPSTSQFFAVLTLLPVSGILLLLAVLTLSGTLIGLAVTTPLFVLCSPVLVPAAFVIGSAILGFFASGAFGITALSFLSCMLNYFRRMRGCSPHQMEQTNESVRETTRSQWSQKAEDMGQNVQNKAQEVTSFKLDIHTPTILELFDGWHT